MDRNAEIWWGAITTARQAREIISWAAWSLIVIGVAPAAALAVAAVRGEVTVAQPFWENLGDNWYVIGQSLFVTVVIAEAALLLKTRSWVAALMLFLCCAFVVSLVLATILRLGSGTALSGLAIAQNLVLIVCLMFFTHLVWRAMDAAQSLRRLQLVEHFS
jgi:hypothetical protein